MTSTFQCLCSACPGLEAKLTCEDNVKAFLLTFEQATQHEHWKEEHWVDILAPFLSGEAQHAYYALPPDPAAN